MLTLTHGTVNCPWLFFRHPVLSSVTMIHHRRRPRSFKYGRRGRSRCRITRISYNFFPFLRCYYVKHVLVLVYETSKNGFRLMTCLLAWLVNSMIDGEGTSKKRRGRVTLAMSRTVQMILRVKKKKSRLRLNPPKTKTWIVQWIENKTWKPLASCAPFAFFCSGPGDVMYFALREDVKISAT